MYIIHQILTLKILWIFTKNAKPYSFLVIDATPASDNRLHFRKNLLERTLKLIMTINDKIRSEKLQYSINREEGKY